VTQVCDGSLCVLLQDFDAKPARLSGVDQRSQSIYPSEFTWKLAPKLTAKDAHLTCNDILQYPTLILSFGESAERNGSSKVKHDNGEDEEKQRAVTLARRRGMSRFRDYSDRLF